jgi:hypothetical protein
VLRLLLRPLVRQAFIKLVAYVSGELGAEVFGWFGVNGNAGGCLRRGGLLAGSQ